VHHAAGAGDDRTVVAYAPAAGREAAKVGAHRQALIHYEVALRTNLLSSTDRAAVLDEYAWELYNAHRVADAVDASRQAVELHRSNDEREAAGVTMVSLAHQLLLNGEPAQAFATITEALAILEEIGSVSSRAYVTTYYGSMLGTAEVLAMAVPILERALGLSVEAQRPDLQALCSIYLGLCREDLDNKERITMIRRGVVDAAANGDHEGAGRGYTILAELLNRFGYLNELEECIAEGSAYMVDHDLPVYSLRIDIMRCQHMIRGGQWDAAERELRAILATVDAGSMVGVIASAHLGKVLARRGSADAAEFVNATFERAKAARINLPLAYAGLAHAEWSWLSGQPVDATGPTWTVNSAHPVATPMYAEFLRHQQRGGQRATVFAGCPEPWASGLRGNWRAAADAWALIGDPYEQALELGDSYELGPMFQSLSILDGLGADAAAAVVRKRLRNMGVQRLPRGPAATTRANPSGLTERQSEVLALIGDGLTNTEIAQRLFLSVRTVDHHVSAILMKLEVSTRREAVALARRQAAGTQPVR
jgi:DNA-binding CsgD family transcriptional regulator/tetratricopeptide (TPR) repeat protein